METVRNPNSLSSYPRLAALALRGTVDHSYYGYTLGKLFIKKARERLFHAPPDEPIRPFHDKLLRLGGAPVARLESLII